MFRIFNYIFLLLFCLLTLLIIGCNSENKQELSIDNMYNLLEKYGWEPETRTYSKIKVKIPESFHDKPGYFPKGLYWSYNNILSKEIGLDISPYKGVEVNAYIVLLKTKLTEPEGKRAIIIEYSEKIIGAWIDEGRHYSFCCSLNGKTFKDIVHKSWGQWLIDNDMISSNRNELPEQVIRRYYNALDNNNYIEAYSLYSKAAQSSFLFNNISDDKIYHDDWPEFENDLTENIVHAKVLKIEPVKSKSTYNGVYHEILNREIFLYKTFFVETDIQFKKVVEPGWQPQKLFITLVKETPDSPWEIDSAGTGS
ncbi:MAG: DUF4830 domain-containing protein [Bacillota bacterium]